MEKRGIKDLNPSRMILDSIIIYNPKFKPKVKKAYEEDIQDAKLLYYYSVSFCLLILLNLQFFYGLN